MTPLAATDKLFFERADAALDRAAAEGALGPRWRAATTASCTWNIAKASRSAWTTAGSAAAGFDTSLGFGLRAVAGEATGYAHAGELSEPALRRAAASVAAVAAGHSGVAAEPPRATNARLYSDANPLGAADFPARTALLADIDAYARGKDPRVVQVMASIGGEWQAVQIMRPDGTRVADLRPLVRLNVSVVVEQDGRRETGSYGTGGRFAYDAVTAPEDWRGAVDEALRQALVNLDSVPAPAGEMEVVLGPGWPGILLHEAIGHGLEGDFNRKKTSAFAGLLGNRIASPGVTVVDDGTLPDRRGSLTVDDEGHADQPHRADRGRRPGRLHAGPAECQADGHARRPATAAASPIAHAPMPRMTNTVMLAGPHARTR